MPDTTPPIATQVRARREKLGRTQEEVVQIAHSKGHGISLPTFRAVEQGQRAGNLQGRTRRGLAAGLDWPVSHIDQLLSGEPVNDEPAGLDESMVRRLIAEELGRPAPADQLTQAIRSLDAQQLGVFESLLDALRDRIEDERLRRADEA